MSSGKSACPRPSLRLIRTNPRQIQPSRAWREYTNTRLEELYRDTLTSDQAYLEGLDVTLGLFGYEDAQMQWRMMRLKKAAMVIMYSDPISDNICQHLSSLTFRSINGNTNLRAKVQNSKSIGFHSFYLARVGMILEPLAASSRFRPGQIIQYCRDP
jgi:hypothetical protein